MKLIVLLSILLLIAGCATNKTGNTEALTQQQLGACHGLGIIAEDLAQIRDGGVRPEETLNNYLRENPNTLESLKPRLAVIAKSVFEFKELNSEAFLHVYNYTCMASFQGVSLDIAQSYLLKNAQLCSASINRSSMLSGCIQKAYYEILRGSTANK
jgi:hypothetical protein